MKAIYLNIKDFKKVNVTKTFPNHEVVEGIFNGELVKAKLAKPYKVVELSYDQKQWFGVNPQLNCIKLEFQQWQPIDLFLPIVNSQYDYKRNKFGIKEANGSLGSRSMIIERSFLGKVSKKLKENGFAFQK